MFNHEDALAPLDDTLPLTDKVVAVHRAMRARFPTLGRVAVATYDSRSRRLRAFVDSTLGSPLLVRYEAPIDDAPSLLETGLRRGPRVVNDLRVFGVSRRSHTDELLEHGFRASYTSPIVFCGSLWGFVFIDSFSPNVFTPAALPEMDVFAHLISGVVTADLFAVRVFLAALRSARREVRDESPRAGAHLDRVSSYTRLMADRLFLSGRFHLSGFDVERIATFGPVYSVSGERLPGQLFVAPGSAEESEYLDTRGDCRQAVSRLQARLREFFEDGMPALPALEALARFHLQVQDGPSAEENVIERRVVGLADLFDSLASPAWFAGSRRPEDALDRVLRLAVTDVDRECVRALSESWPRVLQIQREATPSYGGFFVESPGDGLPGVG